MIGTGLKKLARDNGMTVEAGLAHGMLQGCYVTLTEGMGYKRMSIYLGPQLPSENGQTGPDAPSAARARQIADMITAASGEDNVYRLMAADATPAPITVNHGGSVITVNFFDNPGTMDCVLRFVSEVLPQIAPYTASRQCICCFMPNQGDVAPVRIASDTVVPMHDGCFSTVEQSGSKQKPADNSLVKGVLGAALGALIGSVVFAAVFRFGYVAGIVGFVICALSALGYDLFKGRKGKVKALVIFICTLLAILLGVAGGYALMLHAEYARHATAAAAVNVSAFAYMKALLKDWTTSSDFLPDLIRNTSLGLLCGLAGCIGILRRAVTAEDAADATSPRRLKGRI